MGVGDNWGVEGRGRKVPGGTAFPGRGLPTTVPGILDRALKGLADCGAIG